MPQVTNTPAIPGEAASAEPIAVEKKRAKKAAVQAPAAVVESVPTKLKENPAKAVEMHPHLGNTASVAVGAGKKAARAKATETPLPVAEPALKKPARFKSAKLETPEAKPLTANTEIAVGSGKKAKPQDLPSKPSEEDRIPQKPLRTKSKAIEPVPAPPAETGKKKVAKPPEKAPESKPIEEAPKAPSRPVQSKPPVAKPKPVNADAHVSPPPSERRPSKSALEAKSTPAEARHPRVAERTITPSKKSTAPRGRSHPRITVYVARGGPLRGQADYEQAFPNRHQALAFLSNQHGLTTEEQRQLAKASRLKLNRRWHGSEACALRELALDPDEAAKVLRGEAALA